MPDFQQYLDISNEELQERISGRYSIPPPPPPVMPPEAYDLSSVGDYSPTPPGSYMERRIIEDRARRRYQEIAQDQINRDLLLSAGRSVAGIAGAAALGKIPLVGGIAGYMGGSAAFDLAAEALGWSDPFQVYGKRDYIISEMAQAINLQADLAFSPFQFGARGLSIDQSNRVAERLYDSMRSQGFAGLEIDRMMPGLAESGLLTPRGSFGDAESALEQFSQNIERLSLRIGDAARRAGATIEEATAFVVREEQLAGRALARGDTRLFSSMDLVSQATGMSYDDSLALMEGTLGPWSGMTGDLIPFMNAAAVTVGAGQAAYATSPWATAWDRAGGVGAVASQYSAMGNQYWMERRQMDRMARMYAGGVLTSESMYDLAAGGDFPELSGFSNANDRYEAMFFGMEALARDPLAAQSAAFGDTIRRMENAGVHSREARIGWLVRNRGYSVSQAAAFLDQHQAISTPEGRFAGYMAGQRVEFARQMGEVDDAVAMAMSDLSFLSGEHSSYWASHIGALYRSPDEVVAAGDLLGYVQDQMATDATVWGREDGMTSGFLGRRGATSIMDPSSRTNIGLAASVLEGQLAARGLYSAGVGREAVAAGIANMDFRAARDLRLNVRGGIDAYAVDLVAQEMMRRGHGNIFQRAAAFDIAGRRQVEGWLGIHATQDVYGALGLDAAAALWSEFESLSFEERFEILNEIGLENLYTHGDITGFEAGMAEYLRRPEIMARVSTGMTTRQAEAMETLYATGARGQAAREAMISVAGSGRGHEYFSGLTANLGDVAEARGRVDDRARALSVLEGLEATPQLMRFDRGTAPAYNEMTMALAEKQFTLASATSGLHWNSPEAHYTVRDNIANAAFGESWEQLDSQQKAMINEWITVNDTSVNPLTGEPMWGGRQETMLGLARSTTGDFAMDAVHSMYGEKRGTTATVMSSARALMREDRFSAITMSDVSAYNAALAARGTGDIEAYNRVMATFGAEELEALERFNLEMGVISGVSQGDLVGNLAAAEWLSALGTLATSYGADAVMLNDALLSGDRSALRGLDLEGALGDWVRTGDDKFLEQAFADANIELGGTKAVERVEQNRVLQSVADNMAMGITTVRIASGGDPLEVTFSQGLVGMLRGTGESIAAGEGE